MSYQPHPAGRARLTVEQYAELPDDDQFRDELSGGWLIRSPRPGARHNMVTTRIFLLLHEIGQQAGHGLAVMEGGFLLKSQPPTVRGPDVAFIRRERVPEPIPEGFWPLAPELAVEVLSPSNRMLAMQQKVQEYFEGGTLVVWLVDPWNNLVTVFTTPSEAHILRGNELLPTADLIPGVNLSASDLLNLI